MNLSKRFLHRMKPYVLSSRLNDLEGFPVRFRPMIEERFELIEIDQYKSLPSAYNEDIVAVLTYGKEYFFDLILSKSYRGHGTFWRQDIEHQNVRSNAKFESSLYSLSRIRSFRY